MAGIAIRTSWPRIALVLLVLTPVSSAWAQPESDKDKIDQTLRAQGRVILKYATNPASDPSKKELFENYIANYYIPMMTRPDANALGELGKLRYELFRFYVWPSDPTVQKWLTDTLSTRMQEIFRDQTYHRSVRYNALLVLGLLDQQYAIESTANRRPPSPLPEANEFLIRVLAAGLKDARVSPSMMVGALVGLERHAKYRASLPQDAQDIMAKGFMAVMGREKFPQEMSTSVRNWIRTQAATGLAEMASVGDKGQYHQALMKLIDDPTFGVENRCQVAGLLAKIPYKQGDPIDGPAAAKSLAQLAADYGADEAKIALKFEDLQIGGGGNFFAASTGGTHQGFRIVNDQLVYERRRPVAYLTELQAGLTAIEPALPADQQQILQALQETIQPVIDICTEKDNIDLTVAEQIQRMAGEFNRIAPTAGSKPVEVEVEEEDAAEGVF